MKHIEIITLNYNSNHHTTRMLESLRTLNIPKGYTVSVTVVDNASKEPYLMSAVPKKTIPVDIIRSEENLGYVGGNNLGVQHALRKNAEYLMLLNNDTMVDPDVLIRLLAVSQSDPTIGIVVPKIYFAPGHEYHKDRYTKKELGKVFWYAGGNFDWNNVQSVHRGVDEVDHGQYDVAMDISFASGCCMLIPAAVVQRLGMFDTRYFLYFEDADFCVRVSRAGYRLVYEPSAIIWHVSAGSSGSGSKLHDYFLTRNRLLFGMQYAPLRTKFALLREAIRFFRSGREWQKKGVIDYFLNRFGKGSYV